MYACINLSSNRVKAVISDHMHVKNITTKTIKYFQANLKTNQLTDYNYNY